MNPAAAAFLSFSTPETTYGFGSSRLRLHGLGTWKQWRVKSFEMFADEACSDPYAFSFSPVDWRVCYPHGGIPSVAAAYAIGGVSPLYEAALAVTPAPTASPTAAPTEPPPEPFTESPTPSPTASPTASPTETMAPTPAPTYPVICVSDCTSALLAASTGSCSGGTTQWPMRDPTEFGFCGTSVGTFDSFCPEDYDGLSTEESYFCFYVRSTCVERCALSARCPNDDIIGLGYTPRLYSEDFGVEEVDLLAVGGCEGLVLDLRTDHGISCTDDASAF